MCLIPRSVKLISDEADLAHAPVVMVVGTRPPVGTKQLQLFLESTFNVPVGELSVRHQYPEDFPVTFRDIRIRDYVLHSSMPVGSPF